LGGGLAAAPGGEYTVTVEKPHVLGDSIEAVIADRPTSII
jgi:hypothetical protein